MATDQSEGSGLENEGAVSSCPQDKGRLLELPGVQSLLGPSPGSVRVPGLHSGEG